MKKLGWRARFKRLLFAGLLTLAPVAITVFILIQLFQLMNGLFQPLLNPIERYFEVRLPGVGLVMTLLVVLILGWLSTNLVGRRILFQVEKLIGRIPVASAVYSGTKGILEAVSRDQADAFKRVVLIEYPKKDLFAMAFVTGGARWDAVDPRMDDLLLVFVPTTPNPTSGFLLLVPRREAINMPISVEEGVRMVISGGILLPQSPTRPLSLPAGGSSGQTVAAEVAKAAAESPETTASPAPSPTRRGRSPGKRRRRQRMA